MDKAFTMVVGMSIAYAASLLGMGLAWWSWRKRNRSASRDEDRR